MDETTLTEILNAIQSLRIEISSLRGVNGGEDKTRVICEGITGKGTPCNNRATPGSKCCKMHSGTRVITEKKEKKKREKKEVKPKKIQPEHSHGIGEIPSEPCALCMMHGDVLDPELPNCGFEGDKIPEILESSV
jgi:hypothetical protein|tara:strand:+ start:664 stop:1068 length:405 start_codon:yes stop_codon:yes gene_type:complete